MLVLCTSSYHPSNSLRTPQEIACGFQDSFSIFLDSHGYKVNTCLILLNYFVLVCQCQTSSDCARYPNTYCDGCACIKRKLNNFYLILKISRKFEQVIINILKRLDGGLKYILFYAEDRINQPANCAHCRPGVPCDPFSGACMESKSFVIYEQSKFYKTC